MTAELKKWRHTFYSLSLNLKQYIHKFQRGKDLFITLSIVYIQISNAYLPEFLNISINVEANPVWICRQCLYSAVIFNSKLDYSDLWKGHVHTYPDTFETATFLYRSQPSVHTKPVNFHERPPLVSDLLAKTPKLSQSKPYSWNLY